jgi:hypothetical protein
LRQGILYDKPHVPEIAPDVALFDKYERNIKSHKWTEEEWSGYEEAFRKLMMERVLIGIAVGLLYEIIMNNLMF